MALKSPLPGVQFRRSQPKDAVQLAGLLQLGDAVQEGIPTPGVFRIHSMSDFATVIQTAYLCVTAVRDTAATVNGSQAEEAVIGFIALSDELPGVSHRYGTASNGDAGEKMLDMEQVTALAENTTGAVVGATLENSLWLRMLIAPASDTLVEASSATTAISATDTSVLAASQYKPFTSGEMVMSLFRATLGTLSGIEHIFMSLGSDFPSLESMPGVTPLSSKVAGVLPVASSSTHHASTRTFLHLSRATVLPPLTIRQGRVEDYDDVVTLLIAGGPGVITQLPDDFFLEEILQDQDTHNKVVVAENSVTHEVVGVACLRQLTMEEQQHTARLYNTDALDRLKRVSADASGNDAQLDNGLSCTFSIFFLYFNRDFDHSAYRLLPFFFHEFPTCDYATLRLSHTLPLPEPMILERFQYIPLRRYQPHNARGELVPAPDALWVCPRVSMAMDHGVQARVELLTDPCNAMLRKKVLSLFPAPNKASTSTSASRNARPAGSGVRAALHHQESRSGASGALPGFPGISVELLAALEEDLDASAPTASQGGDNESGVVTQNRTVFALTWGEHSAGGAAGVLSSAAVVGVISVQPLSVAEMYALRANYDLDRFLAFNAAQGFNYAATDISLSAEEGPLRYRSSELPGIVVRFVYIRPVFRQHLKFFLREVLRQTQTEVMLLLTNTSAELYQTAVASFTFAPPRRVVEVAAERKKKDLNPLMSTFGNIAELPEVNDVTPTVTQNTATADGKEETTHTGLELSSLFFTTRRFLGDERVHVHPRVVIVGASATALCMLYELLSVPYLDYLSITVVSTDGMPLHPNQRPMRQWQVDGMELLEREYMRLCLGEGMRSTQSLSFGANTIRVVEGTLIDIDTTMKFVHLENSVYEPYDQLLLATGRQYIVPPPIRALQQQEAHGARGGITALSNEVSEARLRQTLAELSQSVSGSIASIVVYGSGLDAIATLSTMVSIGFPAQRLVLCRPDAEQMPFTDAACGQATMALLRALGVTVLDGYGVSRLEFDEETLTSVLLASLSHERKAGDAVELPCALIVCLEENEIDRNVLTALAKRSIVFDGRVIVGSAYETSRPDVLAAGPVAMFTRRYGATEAFEAFNPRDVGRDVAEVLLARLGVKEFQARTATANHPQKGPVGHRSTDNNSLLSVMHNQPLDSSAAIGSPSSMLQDATQEHSKCGPILPSYTSPVSRRVRLPCGYQYVSTVRGSAAFVAEECIPLQFSSTDMLSVPLDDVQLLRGASTGRVAAALSSREMMTLYVHARHRTIDGIVYFGNGTPEVHNYRSLIGMPESLFHLQYRYSEAISKRDSTGGGSYPNIAVLGGSGATTTPAGVLTVPLRNQQFDLISYLRLPTLKPLLTDRFARFFWQLQRDVQTAEEVVAVRERVLAAQQAAGTLTPDDVASRVAALTDAKAFRYKVQLALLKYMHESKDTRSQDMYLPNIERQMARKRVVM
ncbi:conserved hypothetical protein [Leishmania mexicana MHOM/GT/2001/U1103]|uniref:Cilia- and flagella-associated protein 61 N-terminal domain-containing protein n=1 Tax=Leishmania mexicana (strain MHOM/GT/2001/U1103) TaxID=929439 RepID=E9AY44_LEIMU|nr:conserved hypothetical protein [Leishmania mexicana MHOM/GT/2001/U1103]CBZ27885.1 conserved hypothetical protein [Leishmania mexicana MHOM/GT/2001/U1103]